MSDDEAEAFEVEMWRHQAGIAWRDDRVRLGWHGIREGDRDVIAEAVRQGIVVPVSKPKLCEHGNPLGTCVSTVYSPFYQRDFPCPGAAPK